MRENIEKLKLIPTSCISDAMDYFNISGAIKGIKPLSLHMCLVGPAFTVEYELEDSKNFSTMANYSEQLSEYDVIVIRDRPKVIVYFNAVFFLHNIFYI